MTDRQFYSALAALCVLVLVITLLVISQSPPTPPSPMEQFVDICAGDYRDQPKCTELYLQSLK